MKSLLIGMSVTPLSIRAYAQSGDDELALAGYGEAGMTPNLATARYLTSLLPGVLTNRIEAPSHPHKRLTSTKQYTARYRPTSKILNAG
jgi:hypothetical protein